MSHAAQAARVESSSTPGQATQGDAWRLLLEQHARERAEAPAVTQRLIDGRYTSTRYAELLVLVQRYERLFRATTEPGTIIPLCLARSADAIAAMFAAVISGRAFCTINPKLRLPQVEHILARLRSPIALVDATGMGTLRGERGTDSPIVSTSWYVVAGTPLPRVAQRTLDELAQHARVVRLDGSEPDAVATSQAQTVEARQASAERAGCCLFTSGSTGTPKGVLIATDDLTQRARVEVQWLGIESTDVLLNLLPFSFDVGLNQVLSSATAGAELLILDSWLPADVLSAVEQRGVTGIAAVPSIWTDFLSKGRSFDRTGPHRSLRFLTVSGGDLSPAQHERLPQIAGGANIFKTYGQTEAFRIASLRPEDYAARPLSIGRALPGGRLYVLRPDGSRADVGELGEVVHTGVGTMLGYLGEDGTPQPGDAGSSEPKLRENPMHGDDDSNPIAVFSGDLGQLDAEGYLQLAGRRDDLVKISGNRVYPSEVKALLTTLSDVATAEVVVLRGERTLLAAFVVPTSGATLDAEQLRRQLQERAPSYMVPELLYLRAELPRTASGKPDRTLLLEQAVQLVNERAAEAAHKPSSSVRTS